VGEAPKDREAMGERLVPRQSEPTPEVAGFLDQDAQSLAMLARGSPWWGRKSLWERSLTLLGRPCYGPLVAVRRHTK